MNSLIRACFRSTWIGQLTTSNILSLDNYKDRTCDQHRCYSTPNKKRNYYDVLAISPKCSQAEVKSAYYELSKKYHPDTGAIESEHYKFNEISEAYAVLGNRQTRRKYDTGMLRPEDLQRGPSDSDMDIEYQEFLKNRGRFYTRKAPTGRTSTYNFDEYYRMHYGSQPNKSKGQETIDKHMQETKSKLRKQFVTLIGVLVAILLVIKKK